MKTWEGLLRCHAVFMGMAKAVYVRDEETDLWERAERYAKARRLTMSALVLTALEAYLAGVDDG
jgi:N-formylglutamate amidohydrolase